ncbi:uncharacterized protein KGF55_005200 [Candida pseudojiufengensis]|uniref:uncharacterized protein n=1 Tax=Candida pseudojiufengensis TaxID=497109 RepID=UPI002224E38C|nr:uncharacterized protein KGF55_005200 [Candida pseudojiufengensis]KAI5959556.1 hypothetical protein KGF55_005200 [Candida pseudojiufengensis]
MENLTKEEGLRSSSSFKTPKELLLELHQFTTSQNDSFIEILGLIKSFSNSTNTNNTINTTTATSTSSIASVARGLYTKNNELNKIISNVLRNIIDEKQSFKNLINEFILIFDNNYIILINKYLKRLKDLEVNDNFIFEKLNSPIIQQISFIQSFVEKCVLNLRNPFIIEKLKSISLQLTQLNEQNQNDNLLKQLNNIKFDHIQSFDSSSIVSSYFTIDQIKDRTGTSKIYMNNNLIELILLDLNNGIDYNALAIVSINENEGEIVKNLIYPPFRINELSLSSWKNEIYLKMINFKGDEDYNLMILNFQNQELCDSWVDKISKICPLERNNSPLSENFLIESPTKPNNLSGLGINLVTDSEHKRYLSSSEETLVLNKNSIISSPIKKPRADSFVSQYDKSLPIIKKTITNNYEQEQDDDEKLFRIINRRKTSEDYSDESKERPISSQAEFCSPESIESIHDPINLQPIQPVYKQDCYSVPDLRNNNPSRLYQLSTGSAIDISNFGKSHQPEFKPPKKKSGFFQLFKKNSSKIDINSSKSDINSSKSEITTLNNNDSKPSINEISTPPQTPPQYDANPEKSMTRSVSKIPAPFALPSSTSTYFFKQPNCSVLSTDQTNEDSENDLIIPQNLKNQINSDLTKDYYISESIPKNFKISKWKQKYGKWEMITTSESIFVKIVIDSENNNCWLIIFKEVIENLEIIDKPVLLLDINNQTKIRLSSPLDLQINTKNSITNENQLIMIRCKTNLIIENLQFNLNNVLNLLPSTISYNSISTITSSIMDNQSQSKSSTFSSLNSILNNDKDNLKLEMIIRLQKNLDSSRLNNPSSWEIISMMKILIFKNFEGGFNFKFYNELNELKYNWEFSSSSKNFKKIGKAGLLIQLDNNEIFMIECKGKKEFKNLYEIF